MCSNRSFGDPEPHDHVLIANLCHMADGKGGWKALDTAALRDILHAATAFGRVASVVRPPGFEPGTCGLRVRCSAVELEARSGWSPYPAGE